MFAASTGGPSDSGTDSRPIGNGTRPDGGLEPRHALAGLQAGVIGALALVACVMAGSVFEGRSIWVVPNLFATTFYGSEVYRNRLLHTSWTGVALIVGIYGVLGAIWGCIWRDDRKRWLRLYGVLAGLGVYFVFFDYFWRHINPLITLYAPDRQLQLGHVLWGLVLARSPLYARRIAAALSNKPALNKTTPPAIQDVAGPEIKSGEIIL